MDNGRDMEYCKLRREEQDMDLCMKIVDKMHGDGPARVLLTGKSGIGKTWLAKMVGEYATKEGLCYLTIWLHLNNKFEDELSLYENIAFQIGAYVRDDKEEKNPPDLLTALRDKINAELRRKNKLAVEKMNMLAKQRKKRDKASSSVLVPYLLLILDDEGNKTSEDNVMKDFDLENFLISTFPRDLFLKLLITRRKGDVNTTNKTESNATDQPHDTKSNEEIESIDTDEPHYIRSEEQNESHTPFEIRADTKSEGKIQFQTRDESKTLLSFITGDYMEDLFESLIKDKTRDLLKSLQKDWKIDEPLTSLVVRKSMSLPAAVVVLARSFNCIQETSNRLSPKQAKLLKEFLSPCDPAYSVSGYNPTLQLAYQLLETDVTLKTAIVDCFWHSLDFFKHCGCIHYSELITQWIVEGYFDPVRSVKKAYGDGHDILVELINRGILKIQEGDMVVPEMAMDNLIDLRHHGFLGRSRVRFAKVYSGDKNKGLGKITQIGDMIRTVQATKRDNILTLLVSGNRLRREKPKEFFEKPLMKDLEVVVLFDPTFNYLKQSLSELKQLRVLVIRDYDLLKSMEQLKCLRRLEVLEVSGASSVETISDDFFEVAFELQSLNLSGLGVKSLPSSVSQLKCLHSLILRDCFLLEDFPDIQHLERLEVVDVRGAHKLRTCFEENTSKNRIFSRLQRLVLLDFSESKLKRLPMFQDTAVAAKPYSLTWLSLRNCSNLVKLPNLKPLSNLQSLDLAGTTSLTEISAVCFEQKEKLKILNLSGTKFTKLPSTICSLSNLRQLLLRDGSNLEALPNINGLTSLEVFDVSGCNKLHKIEGSFKDMSCLQEVNLSDTRIATLPEFPEKSSAYCSKIVILADSRRFENDTWSQVKEAITNVMSERLSSSEPVDRIQEISREEELGREGEVWGFDCLKKKGFYQSDIYMDVYTNTIPFVDAKSCQEVLEIKGSSNGADQDKEILANVEFVAIVDNSASSLSSIFNDLISVKGCWLEMCGGIEILFSDVDEERLGNLKTLSITNLRRLESICSSSSSFKNLKKLSLDSCPRIKTLFPTSALPNSLEVLNIKFCDKLEKVFEQEVELPNLHTLCLFELPVLSAINAMLPNMKTYKKDKCPKLEASKEDLCGPELETV